MMGENLYLKNYWNFTPNLESDSQTQIDNLIINGVKELNQISHSVVSDRIEAGSFALASSITMGDVEINNINPIIEKILCGQ